VSLDGVVVVCCKIKKKKRERSSVTKKLGQWTKIIRLTLCDDFTFIHETGLGKLSW